MSRDDFLTFLQPSSSSPSARTTALPPDFALLITDTLESPGTFLLTHFAGRALRSREVRRRVVWVGSSGMGLAHYKGILGKNGVQLVNEQQQGRFTFVDGSITSPNGNSLAQLYEAVDTALGDGGEGGHSVLLIVDDVSSLLWSGHSSSEVARFSAGLRALVARSSSSLITLLHGDDLSSSNNDTDDAHLFRRVLQQSDLWLQTTSLSSQTRGELSIYRAPALVQDYGIVDRSGPTALQYKLDEAGPTFSVKGLGRFL